MNYINKREAAKLLKDLAKIPSYRSEKQIAEYLENYFKENLKDYTIRRVPFSKDRYNLICTSGQGNVLYACHMDTVPPKNKSQLNLKVKGDMGIALGAKDMKGGIVSVLLALRELQEMGLKNDSTILFYGDEENTQQGIRKLVEESQIIPKPELIISPESRFTVGYGSRGVLVVRLAVQGKSAHSARPHLGVDAIKTFYAVYQALIKELSGRNELGKTDITITELHGGLMSQGVLTSQPNVVPDYSTGVISIRLADVSVTSSQILKLIEDTVKNQKAQVKELKVLNNYRPHLSSKQKLKHLVNAIKKNGFSVVYSDPKLAGYNDAVLLAQALDAPIANFGPNGEANHTSDEYVSIQSILDTAKVYLLVNKS